MLPYGPKSVKALHKDSKDHNFKPLTTTAAATKRRKEEQIIVAAKNNIRYWVLRLDAAQTSVRRLEPTTSWPASHRTHQGHQIRHSSLPFPANTSDSSNESEQRQDREPKKLKTPPSAQHAPAFPSRPMASIAKDPVRAVPKGPIRVPSSEVVEKGGKKEREREDKKRKGERERRSRGGIAMMRRGPKDMHSLPPSLVVYW